VSRTYEDGLREAAAFLRGVATGYENNAKEWDSVAVGASRNRRSKYEPEAAACRVAAEKARRYAEAVEKLQ